MSVSGNIYYMDESRDKNILIAPYPTYTRSWKNPAIELGLEYIANFEYSVSIMTFEDLEKLEGEVKVFAEYWQKRSEIENVSGILERISMLQDFITEAKVDWKEVRYIIFD